MQENSQDWQAIHLPDISQQPIKLRVARVLNPRFAQLSENSIQQILRRTQQLVKQHNKINISGTTLETQ